MITRTIESIEEIGSYIEQAGHPYFQLQFRGQVCNDCRWKLQPSIIHHGKLGSIESLLKEESRYITTFKERIGQHKLGYRILQAKVPILFQNDWQWLTQAQHYGLPTRLMDWSLDWKRALYFALDDPLYDDRDGQLWIYRCLNGLIFSEHEEGYLSIDPKDVQSPIIIIPAYHITENQEGYIASERQWHQMSRFLVQPDKETLIPLEENPYFKDDLMKLIIPARHKRTIKSALDPAGNTKAFFDGEKDAMVEGIIGDLKRFKETM